MQRLIILTTAVMALMATPGRADWSAPVRVLAGGFADPRIVAQGDTLHIVAQWAAPTADQIVYTGSSDGGQSWSSRFVLSPDSCQALFPRIIVSGSRIMAVWRNVYDYGTGPHDWNITYSMSSNGGLTWGPIRDVLNPGWVFILYFAASGDNSEANVVLSSRTGDSLVFYSIRSTDFGQSWSAPVEIFRAIESGVPDCAASDSVVHFVWDGRFDLQRRWEIRYLRSSDVGTSWSENTILSDSDEFHSELPSICADSPENVRVTWMDFKYSPYWMTGDILVRQSADSGLTWGAERQATFTHYAWGSDVASNGDTTHIVWEDEGTGLTHRSIYYTRSTDDGATWEEPYWIDGTLDDSAYPTLTACDGKVYCAWQDGRANPDTNIDGGLYIRVWEAETGAIENNQEHGDLPVRVEFSVYPNPFNSSVYITYRNLKGGEIEIYDMQGKLIRSLRGQGGDNGKIIWDARDASGNRVSSGEYFLKAGASHNSTTVKLLYLK